MRPMMPAGTTGHGPPADSQAATPPPPCPLPPGSAGVGIVPAPNGHDDAGSPGRSGDAAGLGASSHEPTGVAPPALRVVERNAVDETDASGLSWNAKASRPTSSGPWRR